MIRDEEVDAIVKSVKDPDGFVTFWVRLTPYFKEPKGRVTNVLDLKSGDTIFQVYGACSWVGICKQSVAKIIRKKDEPNFDAERHSPGWGDLYVVYILSHDPLLGDIHDINFASDRNCQPGRDHRSNSNFWFREEKDALDYMSRCNDFYDANPDLVAAIMRDRKSLYHS